MSTTYDNNNALIILVYTDIIELSAHLSLAFDLNVKSALAFGSSPHRPRIKDSNQSPPHPAFRELLFRGNGASGGEDKRRWSLEMVGLSRKTEGRRVCPI